MLYAELGLQLGNTFIAPHDFGSTSERKCKAFAFPPSLAQKSSLEGCELRDKRLLEQHQHSIWISTRSGLDAEILWEVNTIVDSPRALFPLGGLLIAMDRKAASCLACDNTKPARCQLRRQMHEIPKRRLAAQGRLPTPCCHKTSRQSSSARATACHDERHR